MCEGTKRPRERIPDVRVYLLCRSADSAEVRLPTRASWRRYCSFGHGRRTAARTPMSQLAARMAKRQRESRVTCYVRYLQRRRRVSDVVSKTDEMIAQTRKVAERKCFESNRYLVNPAADPVDSVITRCVIQLRDFGRRKRGWAQVEIVEVDLLRRGSLDRGVFA